MPLTFYPHQDDTQKGTLEERADVMQEAAERFKAFVLDATKKSAAPEGEARSANGDKRQAPSDLENAFNWDEIAILLREIRELPEGNEPEKKRKAMLLKKLAAVYEVLRSAKMPKLESVRTTLESEANQLIGGMA